MGLSHGFYFILKQRRTKSMKRTSEDLKKAIVKKYYCGETVSAISRQSGISRTTIYSWIRKGVYKKSQAKQISVKDYNMLQAKFERREKMIKILQSTRNFEKFSLQDKLRAISEMKKDYNVNMLCAALQVSKGTYYNHALRSKGENSQQAIRKKELTAVIEEIYNKNHQIFGAGKIAAIMKDRGYRVSERYVCKIMHENGWFSMRKGAKTLYMQSQKKRENLIKQNFQASKINEIWVSDVTICTYKNRKYYLCVIIDLYSRKVISFHISLKNSTQLTKRTLKKAHQVRAPKGEIIFHSDNGANYISKTFVSYLQELSIRPSYSQSHNPLDNAVCESFFANLKQEEIYRHIYKSEHEFLLSIKKYIDFYNNQRPHASLNYKTPNKMEEDYLFSHIDKT